MLSLIIITLIGLSCRFGKRKIQFCSIRPHKRALNMVKFSVQTYRMNRRNRFIKVFMLNHNGNSAIRPSKQVSARTQQSFGLHRIIFEKRSTLVIFYFDESVLPNVTLIRYNQLSQPAYFLQTIIIVVQSLQSYGPKSLFILRFATDTVNKRYHNPHNRPNLLQILRTKFIEALVVFQPLQSSILLFVWLLHASRR